MSKNETQYVCSACGAHYIRWTGKCESCGAWNTLEKKTSEQDVISSGKGGSKLKVQDFSEIKTGSVSRTTSQIKEFDLVLGGGIVPGAVIILGGDPGIGKSTLALQVAHDLSRSENKVVYVSGEESPEQVKSRLARIAGEESQMKFCFATNIDNIIATLESEEPSLAIIDSIQMMQSEDSSGTFGGVTQLRAATEKLCHFAKKSNTALIIIGHVTKEGVMAGPRTLEHLVDTVLYLEGDRYKTLRILRGVKNRFGATAETGVFSMEGEGLREVSDPSSLFLAERKENIPGSVITATVEGNRSFLLEVQALTSRTYFGYPRRTVSGYDLNRLLLLIAVLKKKTGFRLDEHDIYLNIVGGFKIKEPAIDLAVCMAILSAFKNKVLGNSVVAIGEVGLGGEVRKVIQLEKRIDEAVKLGMKELYVPRQEGLKVKSGNIIQIDNASELKKYIE